MTLQSASADPISPSSPTSPDSTAADSGGTGSVVAQLETLLLESSGAGGAWDPALLRDLDAAEAFPTRTCQSLERFGLAQHYVPVRHGGDLTDLSELIALLRRVARHDITTAVAHAKTFLGAAPIWVAGDEHQAAQLAERIRGGLVVAWGLTERGHGADLLAGETLAHRSDAGWVLNGEKWLINNATQGESICVLARTRDEGGPRGFDFFLVDKDQLAADVWSCLPKVPTHGIRGADISGIRFTGATVPESAHVGSDGAGLELALKALQLTRTMSVGLSLGACDHALLLTTRFVLERRLYGRLLIELPRIRRILADAVADLILMEVVAFVAGRTAAHLPGELSVLAAVTKAFVPSTGEAVISELGEILGVRAFFTQDHADGAFAKLERDHRIVAIFDGSTAVNRHGLIKAFPMLARAGDLSESGRAGLPGLASFARSAEELDPTRLTLASHGGCSVLQALPPAAEQVTRAVSEGRVPADLGPVVDAVVRRVDELRAALDDHRPLARDVPEADFELARRYELCVAAAAALQVWVHNQDEVGDGLWAEAAWLQVCLARVVRALGEDDLRCGAAEEAVVQELVRNEGHGMSILVDR